MKQSIFVQLATAILLSFGSFGLVIGGFWISKTPSNHKQLQLITDTSKYQEIRNHKWADLQQIQHFPPQIPTNAQVLQMAYASGLIPGSSSLQIRLKQPPAKIKNLLTQYRKISQHQYQGGNTNNHINQPNGVPTTFFYTSDSEIETFPSSYEILVLKAEDQSQPGSKWNHGNSYGVAIDVASSEIVYWAEKW
ncbi:MAG: hypothetical protein ACK6A9_10940 [Dolichospermum sp.]|jgi:hypothetical protein|uniref:hypothetical protein n=1 Tax=Dolichospermum circinale TaxID=109265 RepID=UPI00232C0254|nr:hypothetical protein [Dolichospermum circinale]MDB9455155.1 hypothetical protein [Dolichospermum circinale CS-541/06]MDB9461540.1 hypothetical protein [Dolichospermum circinale CS-541/04]MDB9490024.1 hypothetical protein [Dolichospermum circinale CS-534/05]MDB9546653.1 hypothetical protein [Dolichospermum circinale CS-1031]